MKTAIADLSQGECASRGGQELRDKEKKQAGRLLGLSRRFSLDLPDTRIGFDPDHRLAVIELIRAQRPRLVLAPYGLDRHPDHEAAGRLVREACFYAGVPAVGQGTPFRPERLYSYMIHTPFLPSFIVDITEVWNRKMAVIKAYGSQFNSRRKGLKETALSRPEFLKSQEARAVYFGSMIGAGYGEPFFSQGPIPLRHLPGLDFPPPQGNLPPYTSF